MNDSPLIADGTGDAATPDVRPSTDSPPGETSSSPHPAPDPELARVAAELNAKLGDASPFRPPPMHAAHARDTVVTVPATPSPAVPTHASAPTPAVPPANPHPGPSALAVALADGMKKPGPTPNPAATPGPAITWEMVISKCDEATFRAARYMAAAAVQKFAAWASPKGIEPLQVTPEVLHQYVRATFERNQRGVAYSKVSLAFTRVGGRYGYNLPDLGLFKPNDAEVMDAKEKKKQRANVRAGERAAERKAAKEAERAARAKVAAPGAVVAESIEYAREAGRRNQEAAMADGENNGFGGGVQGFGAPGNGAVATGPVQPAAPAPVQVQMPQAAPGQPQVVVLQQQPPARAPRQPAAPPAPADPDAPPRGTQQVFVRMRSTGLEGTGLPPGKLVDIGRYSPYEVGESARRFISSQLHPRNRMVGAAPMANYVVEYVGDRGQTIRVDEVPIAVLEGDSGSGVGPGLGVMPSMAGQTVAPTPTIQTTDKVLDLLQRQVDSLQSRYDAALDRLGKGDGGGVNGQMQMMLLQNQLEAARQEMERRRERIEREEKEREEERKRTLMAEEARRREEEAARRRREMMEAQGGLGGLGGPGATMFGPAAMPALPPAEPQKDQMAELLSKMTDRIIQPPAPPVQDPVMGEMVKMAIARAMAPPSIDPIIGLLLEQQKAALAQQREEMRDLRAELREARKPQTNQMDDLVGTISKLREINEVVGGGGGPTSLMDVLAAFATNGDKLMANAAKLLAARNGGASFAGNGQGQQQGQNQQNQQPQPNQQQAQGQQSTQQAQNQPVPIPESVINTLKSFEQIDPKTNPATISDDDERILNPLVYQVILALAQGVPQHRELAESIGKHFSLANSRTELKAMLIQVFMSLYRPLASNEPVIDRITDAVHRGYPNIYRFLNGAEKVMPDAHLTVVQLPMSGSGGSAGQGPTPQSPASAPTPSIQAAPPPAAQLEEGEEEEEDEEEEGAESAPMAEPAGATK